MPRKKRPPREALPNFISQWREYRHMTQEQVAEAMGMKRESFGKIENGVVKYHEDSLREIAEILRCTPADLLARNPLQPSWAWAAYDLVSALDEPTARRALAILKAMNDGS